MSSLQHILASEPDGPASSPSKPQSHASPQPIAPMPPTDGRPDNEDDDATMDTTNNAEGTPAKDPQGTNYTSTSTTTRRTAGGNTSSVFSGNKIRHLKKDDGVPLWRKDIQYDFLRCVFDDKTACFTKYSDKSKGHNFATVYIDAMASSSKTSKILKEKLLQDQDGAIDMAMVCLLVNVGRMNTTLNFFPEMRAQLRTYHSIPALQAHRDPSAYKQLQDAPRLKSILKGAAEDEPHPSTMEEVRDKPYPRTNPVNLLFVMSQFAPRVSEMHFPPPRDFFDLFTRTSLSSASRAKAFLWLMWWYLESDFGAEASQSNPFGPGEPVEDDQGTKAVPSRVPTLESLTEQQAETENVDTEEEKHFGEVKRKERVAILASEPSPAMTALKRSRKEKGLTSGHGVHASDDEGSEAGWLRGVHSSAGKSHHLETASEYTRSPSPAANRSFPSMNSKPAEDMRINNLLNSDNLGTDQSPPRLAPAPSAAPVKKGPGRGNWRRNRPKADGSTTGRRSSQDGAHHVPLLPNTGHISFVTDGPHSQGSPPGSSGAQQSKPSTSSNANNRDHVPTPSYQAQKRHRGITQHQSAVINHRKQQIEYHLDRRIRRIHAGAQVLRETRPAMFRAWARVRALPLGYDSEGEAIRLRKVKDKDHHRGGGGGGGGDDDGQQAPDAWGRQRVLYAGFAGEVADVGEEVRMLAKTFRRAARRLERWQESKAPGEAMSRRIEYAAEEKQRPKKTPIEEEVRPIIVKSGRGRGRGGGRKRRQVSERVETMEQDAPEAEADVDDGGGGELDEEDREILGEVDADESEADDEDEEMED